ncbi:hypothetical protein KJ596_02980 [Patescibacteria group bacterium]|nr:hypothetical protein [Patescibacteria group bacterium]MBU1868348.1 hypothetical protein [Patescibacteria group bacterium]
MTPALVCKIHLIVVQLSTKTTRLFVLALIFLVVFLSHALSSNVTSFDSRWTVFTSLSLIEEGNTDLNEYSEMLEEHEYYAIGVIKGKYYSIFPVGTSIISMPFVYLFQKIGFPLLVRYQDAEKIVASFFVAISALVVFLTIARLSNRQHALLLTFIYAFCTSMWSTASRALWQHGPSALMLSIALYLIVLARDKPRIVQFLSLPLAWSFVIRPTNALSVLFLTLYVLIFYREYFVKYITWSLVVAIPFLLYNFSVYDNLLPPYYYPARVGQSGFWGEALVGNLVSPGRGLFVFSPILLFSLWGIWLSIRGKERTIFWSTLAATIVTHWFIVSSYPHWWAGHSFGPRFFTDMMPYFVLFLVPILCRIKELKGVTRLVLTGLFTFLVMSSFFVHYRGANSWSVFEWNSIPVNVDVSPERLWDWGDLQFLRGT